MAIVLYDNGLVLLIKLKDDETGVGFFLEFHPSAFACPFVKDTEAPNIADPKTTFEFQVLLDLRWWWRRFGIFFFLSLGINLRSRLESRREKWGFID